MVSAVASIEVTTGIVTNREPRTSLIVTRTPLRISFAGGGTDLPTFYQQGYGAVLSSSIDKYVYVTLKGHNAMFGAPIRLNYSETEECNSVEEIRNAIARACFRFLNLEPPIYMSTVADIPAASGLGSSSAFCVGLLHAIHSFRGEHVSAGQLAEEAAHVEINLLGRPIGKQDHYAAAFGGINFFRFLSTGSVSVEPQQFSPGGLRKLFSHLLMFWTGMTRNAAQVLEEQRRNTPGRMDELSSIREQAHTMQALLGNNFEPAKVGAMFDEGWRLKRKLASTVSNSHLDSCYLAAMEAGAWGGKLCGAGGGGFFLFAAPHHRHAAIRAALRDLPEIAIGYEPQGSRVLMPHVE